MSGNARGASSAFCLLFRLGQLKPSDEDVQKLLDHSDSPFIRAVRESPGPPCCAAAAPERRACLCNLRACMLSFDTRRNGDAAEQCALHVLVALCSMPPSYANPSPPTAVWWQGAPDCLPHADLSASRPARSLPPQAEADFLLKCLCAGGRDAPQHPCRHSQQRQRPAKGMPSEPQGSQPPTVISRSLRCLFSLPCCRRGASQASAGVLAGAPRDAVANGAAGVPRLSGVAALLAAGLFVPAVRGEPAAGLGLAAVLHQGHGGAAPLHLHCACAPFLCAFACLRPQVAERYRLNAVRGSRMHCPIYLLTHLA